MRQVTVWLSAAAISAAIHAGALAALARIGTAPPQRTEATVSFAGPDDGGGAQKAEAVSESPVAAVTESVAAEASVAEAVPQSAEAAAVETADPVDESATAVAAPPDETAAAAPVSEGQDVAAALSAAKVPAESSEPAAQTEPAGSPDAAVVPDTGDAASLSDAAPAVAEESGTGIAAPVSGGAASAVEGGSSSVAGVTSEGAAAPVETAAGVASVIEEAVSTPVPADAPAKVAQSLGAGEQGEAAGQRQAVLIPRVPPPPPRPASSSRAEIGRFLRERGSGGCFLAEPHSIGDGAAEVEAFGSAPEQLAAFRSEFEAALKASLRLGETVIAQQQCDAIGFVMSIRTADSRIALNLSQAEIPNGGELRADISGADKPFVTLFLVDDEGYVADVSKFMTRSGSQLQFRTPVHLSNEGSGKPQLLIAVSSPVMLNLASPEAGSTAAEVFPLLLGEIRFRKLDADIAIASFRVR